MLPPYKTNLQLSGSVNNGHPKTAKTWRMKCGAGKPSRQKWLTPTDEVETCSEKMTEQQ